MSSPAPGERTQRSAADEAAIEVGVRAPDGSSLTIRTHDPAGDPAGFLTARDAVQRSRARIPSHPAGFTPRQREILSLVGDGLSNGEIAESLGISRRTVEKHVETIHAKAGTATRARLVAFARDYERRDSRRIT